MTNFNENDFYNGENPIEISEFENENKLQPPANSALDQTKMIYKLLKISNRRGHPNFHFEINEKVYVYAFKRFTADFQMALICKEKSCRTMSRISGKPVGIVPFYKPDPEFLKQTIQNVPNFANSTKCLDKSDSRVYDIKNYDINSFVIGKNHKCTGTELDVYLDDMKNQVILTYITYILVYFISIFDYQALVL